MKKIKVDIKIPFAKTTISEVKTIFLTEDQVKNIINGSDDLFELSFCFDDKKYFYRLAPYGTIIEDNIEEIILTFHTKEPEPIDQQNAKALEVLKAVQGLITSMKLEIDL